MMRALAGTGLLRTSVEPVADLAADAAWDALAFRAVAPHPFFTRAVVAAHRDHGFAHPRLGAVVVREGDAIAALLPFSLRPDIAGLGATLAQPFLSPYVTETTPSSPTVPAWTTGSTPWWRGSPSPPADGPGAGHGSRPKPASGPGFSPPWRGPAGRSAPWWRSRARS